jgi:hypothetical protein
MSTFAVPGPQRPLCPTDCESTSLLAFGCDLRYVECLLCSLKHLSLTFFTFIFQILTFVLPVAQHTSHLRHRRALVITIRRRCNVCRAPVIVVLISLANVHWIFFQISTFTTCGQPTISRERRRALVILVQRRYKVCTIASLCTQTPLANLPEFIFQVLTFGRLDSLFRYFEYYILTCAYRDSYLRRIAYSFALIMGGVRHRPSWPIRHLPHLTTTDGVKKATVGGSSASDRDSRTYSDPSCLQVNPLYPQVGNAHIAICYN